jgi:hypothetical protein
MPEKKSKHLNYGEGQREQYGEGSAYRPEDKAANDMGENEGFGADNEKGATSRKMAPKPAREAKGGLPEKHPPKKE